jgi:hypothetical protein
MLQGEELDTSVVTDNNIVLDIAEPVTNDNLEAEWAEVEDEEDNYVLDSILTADEVGQYFGD